MAKVVLFISYSRHNEDIASRLRADLGQAGAVIWIDHEQLRPGTPDWEAAVRSGIAQANAVIFVASPQARQSQYVRDEITIARDQSKPVYPFWAAGDNWHDSVPLGWGSTQYADGRGARYSDGLRDLVTSLGLVATGQVGNSSAAVPGHAPSPSASHLPAGLASLTVSKSYKNPGNAIVYARYIHEVRFTLATNPSVSHTFECQLYGKWSVTHRYGCKVIIDGTTMPEILFEFWGDDRKTEERHWTINGVAYDCKFHQESGLTKRAMILANGSQIMDFKAEVTN